MKKVYNLKERYNKSIDFLVKSAPPPCKILDLGTTNLLSKLMIENGYNVINTEGEDLDIEYDIVKNIDFDLVTAFEIFEHLMAPLNILREIKAEKLVASIPLNLWFAKAYWNKDEEWDRHYHEFEDRQFDWLLKKAGWEIILSEKWIAPTKQLGIRPILRRFTPRYYIVYCVRKKRLFC